MAVPGTRSFLALTDAASAAADLEDDGGRLPASTTLGRSSSSYYYCPSSAVGASSVVSSAASDSLVAVFNFRTSPTVGLACFSHTSPTLRLSVLHDNLSSTLTMAALLEMNASDVLVAGDTKRTSSGDGAGGSGGLVNRLRSWDAVRVEPVPRRNFNELVGREMLAALCSETSVRTASLDSSHYLCVCAAAALLRHVREQLSVHVAPQSLHLSITPLRQLMKLDVRTAAALELVACRNPAAAASSSSKPRPAPSFVTAAAKKPPRTLYDALNRTRTTAGARLLRSSLLQPFREPDAINARLDAVEELLAKQLTLSPLSSLIADFNHYDSTLTQCLVHLPPDTSVLAAREAAALQKDSSRSSTLLHIMALRRWMPSMQSVAALLVDCNSALLSSIHLTMSDPLTADIDARISAVLDESVVCSRGSDYISLRNSLVCAVREGVDSFLDTTRQVYVDTLRDINAELSRVNEIMRRAGGGEPMDRPQDVLDRETGAAGGPGGGGRRNKQPPVDSVKRECKLIFTHARGFHLQLPAVLLNHHLAIASKPESRLGSSIAAAAASTSQSSATRADCVLFQQAVVRGKTASATTQALLSLSTRASEQFIEVMVLSSTHTTPLLAYLRSKLPFLVLASDKLALLDLLLSFMHNITNATHCYCRPTISRHGQMALKDAVHPLQYAVLPSSTCVPNHVFLDRDCNVNILTGANGGGKSCYLKMVGVVAVMAACGMYVPAERAHIRLADELVVRTSDDHARSEMAGETDTSALYREMRDLGAIVRAEDTRRLILLDEIGRSTSAIAGLSLAWSIAETLSAHSGWYCILATHHTHMASLAHLYDNILNISTQVEWAPPALSAASPSFTAPPPSRLHYLYTVADGAFDPQQQYGIDVAASCAFNPAAIDRARRIADRMKQAKARAGSDEEGAVEASVDKARRVKAVLRKLRALAENEAMPTAEFRQALIAIRNEFGG